MAGTVHVILARDVDNLGRIGDLAAVKPGYARNYLIPQGLALPASQARMREFEHKKRVVEHQRARLKSESQKLAGEIAQAQVTISARVGEQDKLFGSIGARDIAEALAAEGHKINHRDLKMDGPIKTIGMHMIDLRLEADVTTQVKVIVAAEKVAEEEMSAESFEDEDSQAASNDDYAEDEAEMKASEAANEQE